MRRILETVGVAAVTLLAVSTIATSEIRAGEIGKLAPKLVDSSRVTVACADPGTGQEAGKKPKITNNTGFVIPKGRVVDWKTDDGDKGSITLTEDLADGASVNGAGTQSKAYTCSASFNAGDPDLVVRSAVWESTEVKLQIKNGNQFAAAGPSVTRVTFFKCNGSLIGTADSPAVAVAKGETKAISIPTPANFKPEGKTFLLVKADAKKAVTESNEDNNDWDGKRACQ
jgi:hypothetical protein